MLPAQLLTRLRTSALYLFCTVLLLGGIVRSLVLAFPKGLAADRTERRLESLDHAAYAAITYQTAGQEQLTATANEAHRQYDALRRQANEALVDVFGYAGCWLAALLVYVRTGARRMAVEVCLLVSVVMMLGLLASIHWGTISRIGRTGWALLAETMAPQHLGNQVLLLSLLAGAALCYDLLRPRKDEVAVELVKDERSH